MALVVALASCFSGAVLAQPSGHQVVHGSAALSQQGNTLLVTTHNGLGTSHSAINWQSFSVPAGTATHFAQPGATSTSINRVLGNDPSAIFGKLSSNGRLVLVNPAGIAVGAGALVDTAGFTASTLRMSDADALAGRMRFADGVGGTLRVDGQVLARSGDVVLIGSQVQAGAGAVIQSPEGATILAAGQKVEITGRGLEGIRFELQSASDQALNLGQLRGDAVGVFAGSLRHSGVVRADAVSTEGGRVVLKASSLAETSGAVHARGLDGRGGQADVLGATVGVLGGAVIDTSNTAGGGQIRVGGDYLGANAAVPNAQVTYVAPDAQLRANATQAGDGGRVIMWADDTARVYGSIEAQGGPAGGQGGFVETSGKRYLDVEGIRGVQAQTWLLDPASVRIVAATPPDQFISGYPNYTHAPAGTNSVLSATTLNTALAGNSDVSITADDEIHFDASSSAGGNITLARATSGTRGLTLNAGTGIRFSGGETSFQATGDPSAGLVVNFRSGAGLVSTDAGATTRFNVAGAGAVAFGVLQNGTTWTNNGTVDLLLNGYLKLHDGAGGSTFNNAGIVNLFGGGVLGHSGALGTVVNTAGATIRTQGPNGNLLEASVINQGAINNAHGLEITRLQQTAGSLVGVGPLYISHQFQQTGGTFNPGGDTEIRHRSGNLTLQAYGGDGALAAGGSLSLLADDGNIYLQRAIQAGSKEVLIATVGSNTASGNNIQLNANIQADTLAVLASGAGAVTQSAGFQADKLLLQTNTGPATLTHADNQARLLAASADSLNLGVGGALEIGIVATSRGTLAGVAADNVALESRTGGIRIGTGGLYALEADLRAASAIDQTREVVALALSARSSGGSITLTHQDNAVDLLAASGASLDFKGTGPVSTGFVNGQFGATGLGGVNVSGMARLQSTNSSLSLGGGVAADSVHLKAVGPIGQSAAIVAGALSAQTSGAVTLNHVNNDIDLLAVQANSLQFKSKGSIVTTGTVARPSQTTLSGIAVAGAASIEATDGALALGGGLNAGSVHLKALGTIGQSDAIVTGALSVQSGGAASLTHTGNDIDLVAASASSLQLKSKGQLTTGAVSRPAQADTLTGINAGSASIESIDNALVIGAGGVSGGNVHLAAAGDITQSGAILTNALSVRSPGNIILMHADNDIDLIAAEGAALALRSKGTVRTGTVSRPMQGDVLAGITATGGVTLESVDSGLVIEADLGASQAHLKAAGSITQTAAIRTSALSLQTPGAVVLGHLDNEIGVAAASAADVLLRSNGPLSIGPVSRPAQGDILNGIQATGSVRVESFDDSLTLGAITANNLHLKAGAGITQTATLSANDLTVQTPGAVTLTATGNAIQRVAASVGSMNLVNGGALATGALSRPGSMTLDGIDASGAVRLRALTGQLTVGDAVGTGGLRAGSVHLKADAGDIRQNSAIDTPALLAEAGAAIRLTHAGNAIDRLAASGVSLNFVNAGALTTGYVASSLEGGGRDGISITNAARLQALTGDLTVGDANSGAGQGSGGLSAGAVHLRADAGGIAQVDAITAPALLLEARDAIELTSTANAVGLVAAQASSLNLVSAGSFTTGHVARPYDTGAVDGIDVSGAARLKSVNGSITIGDAVGTTGPGLRADTVALQALNGGISQTDAIASTFGVMAQARDAIALAHGANAISVIAATGASLNLVSSGELVTGNVSSPLAGTLSGVTVTNNARLQSQGNLWIGAGGLNVDSAYLTANGGSIQQSGGTVSAGNLLLEASNGVTLTDPGNQVGRVAAMAPTVNLVSDGSMTAGYVYRASQFGGSIDGITATSVRLESRNGNLTIGDNGTGYGAGAGGLIATNVHLQALGTISQVDAIDATNLALEAGGGITLTHPDNRISVVGAQAASLDLKTRGTLSTGFAPTPWRGGGVGGIDVAGVARLESTDAAVNVGFSIDAGSVMIKANGAGGSVQVNAGISSNTGDIRVESAGGISMVGVAVNGETGISMRAGGDITTGHANASADLYAANGALVMEAGGNLIVQGPGYTALEGQGVTLRAGGDLLFNVQDTGVTSVNSHGGSVLIGGLTPTHTGSIRGSLAVDSSSGSSAAGAVALNAGGSIHVASLDASGAQPGTTGGAIQVTGGGDVHVQDTRSVGAYDNDGTGSGGNGGSVTIVSTGGNVLVDYIDATGRGGNDGGGTGGNVTLRADVGHVVVADGINVDGGSSDSGQAGRGGIIALRAPLLAVRFDGLSANGGRADSDTASAGAGGDIRVQAGTAIGPASVEGSAFVSALGGNGYGSGGTVAGAGATGGTVVLQVTNGVLDLGAISVDAKGGDGGGGAYTGQGGTGGTGGQVTLLGFAGIRQGAGGTIDARGGQGGASGGTAATDRAGRGGAGGVVQLEAGGHSDLAGTIRASGGFGGDVLESGNAVSGNGGTGGTVTLALSGSVLLGGYIGSGGGFAGSAWEPDGEFSVQVLTDAPAPAPLAPSRSGALGSDGNVVLAAERGARVTDTVHVDGHWRNTTQLALGEGSSVTVGGALTNSGGLGFGAGASVTLYRADAQGNEFAGAGLLTNTGLMHAAGEVHGNLINAGTLQVSGSGGIGSFRIDGNFSQQASGTLDMDIAGPSAGTQHDQLVVTGKTSLGGLLKAVPQPPPTVLSSSVTTGADSQRLLLAAAIPGAYVPAQGDSFTLIDAQGGITTGTRFAELSTPTEFLSLLRINDAGVSRLVPVAPAPPAAVPAPTSAPTRAVSGALQDRIAALLGNDVPTTLIARAVADQGSVLGTFLTLLAKEEESQVAQKEKNRQSGDIVTDSACK